MKLGVSVLIPAYNGADFLPATIDSILSQSLPPEEVIVVDDGSTDKTREIISGFGRRVSYMYKENQGICQTRNKAAELAAAPYLAFCDQDDIWRKDKLARQMELHQGNRQLEYSFTNFSIVVGDVWADTTKLDDGPTDFFRGQEPSGRSAFEFEHSLYEQLLEFQPIWPSTIVITRDFFNYLGGFREELGKNPSEDLEFTLRCVQQGPIGVVREPVVGVRRHSLNYSGDTYKNTLGQIEILHYALQHHDISEHTRALILRQIELRRVEASYGAFRAQHFETVSKLLGDLPVSSLDAKTRLKLRISKLPVPLAKLLQGVLLKEK